MSIYSLELKSLIKTTITHSKKHFLPTYLYIKQHKITGKLYFGKTNKNPEEYSGSGTRWTRHINKHGVENVDTIWYCMFNTKESIVEFSLSYCYLNNIGLGDTSIWLNLKPENGLDGGNCIVGMSEEKYNSFIEKLSNKPPISEESRNKISDALSGIPKPIGFSENLSALLWCNNGTRNKRVHIIPVGFVEGKLPCGARSEKSKLGSIGINKNKVTCYDKELKILVAISTEEFYKYKTTRYITPRTTEYKLIKAFL